MKKIRILGSAGAAVALSLLLHRIGLQAIVSQLESLRFALPVVLLAGLVRLFLQTSAWSIALRAEGIDVPQPRLIAVRLASQAAGYMTVLGPVVSEPTKLVLLRNPSGMAAAAPATFVETGAYWFTTVLLGLAGTCAGAFLIANSRAVWAAAVLFAVAIVLLGTRHSFSSLLVAAAGPRAPRWLRTAEVAELGIRSFRDRHRVAFAKVMLLDALAQVVTLVEVGAVLWAAGIRPSVPVILVIEAAGRMIKILAAWIPGRIGVDEGGAAASFAMLGLLPASGLMLATARRLRDMLCCAAGLLWAACSSAREQTTRAVSQRASLCTEEN